MTLPAAITDVLPPDDRVRIGIVSQASPLLVDVQGAGIVAPGVLNYAQFTAGDVVALIRQDQSWLVMGTVASSDVTGMTGQGQFNALNTGDTTTSAGFADFDAATTTWVKRLSGTRVRFDHSMSCYTTAVNTKVEFGMQLLGAINSYASIGPAMMINAANEHTMVSGHALLAGVPAGTYTVRPIWRRVSGAGVLTANTDDWISYIVSEVN